MGPCSVGGMHNNGVVVALEAFAIRAYSRGLQDLIWNSWRLMGLSYDVRVIAGLIAVLMAPLTGLW